MMKRITAYLGLALASCLSCFSLPALAEPLADACRTAYVVAEPQGVALQRLELTLAMWRTGSQPNEEGLKANLRVTSNHFVQVSAKPLPESDSLTPC